MRVSIVGVGIGKGWGVSCLASGKERGGSRPGIRWTTAVYGARSEVLEERLEGHDLVVEQLLELLLVQLLIVELEVLWVERGHRGLVFWVVLRGGAQVSRKAG